VILTVCGLSVSGHSTTVDIFRQETITVMLNEAKTSRPELRGRGQFLDVEAKAEAKNNYEKSTND